MQNLKPFTKQRSHQKRKFRLEIFLTLLIISAIAIFCFSPRSVAIVKNQSNYTIHKQQSFNQPQFYPITQAVDRNLYQPLDEWVGRLILPSRQEIQGGADWVWLEVQHAPTKLQRLVGKVVRLEWHQPEVKSYVNAVKRDVKFTEATKKSEAGGTIHPARLDGRLQVGPLQSLAGARPNDDVIVALNHADLIEKGGEPHLLIKHEPVIATGRFYGLVKILDPQPTSTKYPAPPTCPGTLLCPSDFFRVRHYNIVSGNFDGVEETIRIPQQVVDTRNIPPSTPRQIEKSQAGEAGWYIYGAENAQGIFVVQGIAPRSLFQLQPKSVILGHEAGLTYIKEQNWFIKNQDKGAITTVLLDPAASQSQLAQSQWKEGDRAILLHNFGGIGGKKAENLLPTYTVTGHFAFGVAQIIRDPLTKELRFAVEYDQIYAHNSDGIIAGKHTWADYMGNLQWGWVATRPISDVLIKFDPVTQDYDFAGIKLSPMTEFLHQLQVMIARYRIGDGTGSATVSPATSCVQDANQAIYIAIQAISQQVSSNPAIQQWLNSHPSDPQTLRFEQLISLGSALNEQLAPLGIVRADWQSNADVLIGIGNEGEPAQDRSVWAALTSWRTMLPRQAHDELATIFFRHGAKLWFLRTNQIGGWDQDIAPLPPTAVLGQITIPFTNIAPIPIVINRLLGSLALPQKQDWLIVVVAVLIYSAIALPLGLYSGFLRPSIASSDRIDQLKIALKAAIAPAFTEELVFRVLLLPHPLEVVNWYRWIFWATFILILFIVYHPLNAKTFFQAGFPTFFQPIFLTLTGILGLCCTLVYGLTGSLWAIVFIHWIVVVVWLLALGGKQNLLSDKN